MTDKPDDKTLKALTEDELLPSEKTEKIQIKQSESDVELLKIISWCVDSSKDFQDDQLDRIWSFQRASGLEYVGRLIQIQTAFIIFSPMIPQYKQDRAIVMDDEGNPVSKTVLKIDFYPLLSFGRNSHMIIEGTDLAVITPASPVVREEYRKKFPVEKSLFAKWYQLKKEEILKAEAEKKNTVSSNESNGGKKVIQVLDDGRVIHEVESTVH